MPKLKPDIISPTPEEDEEITRAANSDPDARPFTDEEWEAAKPMVRHGAITDEQLRQMKRYLDRTALINPELTDEENPELDNEFFSRAKPSAEALPAELVAILPKQRIDVRHEEFRAMTDAFLGKDYDKEKLAKVEELQLRLRNEQDFLSRQYSQGDITAGEFVDAHNTLSDKVFTECEQILGPKDFEELFGAPSSERLWRVDKDAFLNDLR